MAETRVHLSKMEPAAYRALAAFSESVGKICADNGIDDRLKELVMLHSAMLNGCAFCVRVHTEYAVAAGLTIDDMGQIAVWRESGIFTDRERAGLELAEAFVLKPLADIAPGLRHPLSQKTLADMWREKSRDSAPAQVASIE